MIACIGPIQDQAQNSCTAKVKEMQAPPIPEELLGVNSCWGRRRIILFFRVLCSTINKNAEIETGVKPKGQKNEAASHRLLAQSEMVILLPGTSE